MTEISIEKKKIIQLDILSAVDEFCREYNIRYSIACGTLLGAVRHGGFIPWDDDIDIYIPRNDYLTFEQYFPDGYKHYYQLYSALRERNGICLFRR